MPKAAASLSALSLCAFRAGVADFGAQAAAPSRLIVAPLGQHDARDRGKVIVNAATLAGFAAAQKAAKLDGRVALDFEHNTVPGTPAFIADKEPRAIAAWATALAADGIGIVFENIQWTPQGLAAWKDQQFQDISPAVFRRADGTVIALHSAALCRHGEIDGLTIEAAAAPSQLAPFFAALSATLPESQSPSMKPTPALIALLAACSVTLAADADESTIDAALKEALAKVKAEEGAEPPAGMTALAADLATLKTQLTALTAQTEDAKKDALMTAAKAEGKVIPLTADLIKLTPIEALTAIIAAARPGEVPLEKTGSDKDPLKTEPEAFSAAELKVMTAFGLTEDEVRKSLNLEKKAAA